MVVVGALVVAATVAFSPQIIWLVGGEEYLTKAWSLGSDFLLPWLAVVLFGSFVKQSFNYLFLAIKKQNILLSINGIGILIGLPFALFAIRERWLLGALRGQWILELLFVIGSVVAAHYYKALPRMHMKNSLIFGLLSVVCIWLAFGIHSLRPFHAWYWSIPLWLWLLWVFFLWWRSAIKDTLRGLG
jgi:O-antigen/teichoic acid export membrane protein